jgi:enoyl-CoA hydratase
MAESVIITEVRDGVAVVTMNRPDARNALNRELRAAVPAALTEFDADPDVHAMILTGADPAFCAGLDLKELSGGSLSAAPTELGSDGDAETTVTNSPLPFGALTKPLIGAVNGPAVTGGFELALGCDFLIASERARFGDTHARVGVMPGWGLTVLLPQAIGVRRAREMSFTGNFLSAQEALQVGLVNHVVPHDDLLDVTRRIARDIVGNDQTGVRQIRSTYAEITADADGWAIEARDGAAWARSMFDPARVAERRDGIISRGRTQQT